MSLGVISKIICFTLGLAVVVFSFYVDIFKFLEGHQVFLTIVGWLAVFFLSLYAGNKQLRNNARLEIYKEFQELKQKIDDPGIELSLFLSKFTLPFNDMEWAEKDIPKGSFKRGQDVWLERSRSMIDAHSKYFESHQRFINATQKWNLIMPKLKKARNILYAEFSELNREIWEYINFYMSQIYKESDWRKWDRNNIEQETEKIAKHFYRVIGFLNDYLDMVTDELVRPIFNVKSVRREDFNYVKPIEAETLTENGIKFIKYEAREGARLHNEKIQVRKNVKKNS